ncbi:MAG: hypothetical protein PSV26_05505 [Polaromonas sp.]|uniref:hypothetical protein n=1 Tax=Polaromonas sp. TaxID=1869339 RepID=UPI002489BB70|nr:hypothetical protein [Polaromonas sp.]MDI1236927.1 hypothetical protein [Polaromonas sp.]MDI1339482.1 hypothetical protein [Polaromonas sp.]
MTTKFLPTLFLSMAVSGILSGCQVTGKPANMPPFGSLAQITAISPDTNQVLRPGQQVKLKVDVSYVLTSDAGTIKLIVLAADSAELGQDVKVIAKGSGKATLETQFTVPTTTEIRVFAPLVVQGESSGSATDGRSYKVLPR